jgi:hypothetical protein
VTQPPPRQAPIVLVFGLRPERLVDAEARIDAFLEPPERDQVGLLVDALASGLEAAGAVVAIVPDWFSEESLARLRMARSLLQTERVAVHVTPLPPLAATVLASVASATGRYLPSAGVLASLLPELEAELHVITWLGSVAGLSTPAPSLGQHLASLTPGRAFAVSSYPEPAVHRLGPDVPLPPVTRPSRLAVADAGGDASWLLGPVHAALGSPEIRQVEATPGGAKWWGTSKLVEGVVYPVDIAELAARLLSSVEQWSCRWCGELVAAAPCPLCGHRGRPPGARVSTAPG